MQGIKERYVRRLKHANADAFVGTSEGFADGLESDKS